MKTALAWARELGIIILDPDGWRKNSPYGYLSMETPITREDFDRRSAISTIGPRLGKAYEA